MKGYGSTSDPATPSRGVGGDDGDSSSYLPGAYATPRPSTSTSGSALPRTESAGGATAQTNETEPLLGEQWLLGNDDDDDGAADIDPKSMFLSPAAGDASTIDRVGSDQDLDTAATAARGGGADAVTPQRTGSPRKQLVERDPHIGTNVELDTLAYSRDGPDDSTMLTNDNFSRKYLASLDEEEGDERKGFLGRLLSRGSGGADPPVVLVCIGLGVGIGLCFILLVIYVEINHHQGQPSALSPGANATASSLEGTWHGVPYAKISRGSFGDPVSNIMDVSLFHPSLLYDEKATAGSAKAASEQPPAEIINDDGERRLAADASPKPFLRVPFPTGAFWTNLVVLPKDQQRASAANQYSYPIVAYPYSYQWSALGKLQASYSAARRVMQATSIQDAFAPDVTVGSVESISARHVVRFDSLSVTLRFYSRGDSRGGGGAGTWETYIVQGSPYVTAKFTNLAPEITALSDFDDIACPKDVDLDSPQEQDDQPRHRALGSAATAATSTAGKKLGICATASESTVQKKVVTGVQFVVTTKEGLTWLVFASEPISFEFNRAARRVIQSRGKYGGVLRLALVPPPNPLSASASATSTSGTTAANSLDAEQLASSSGVKRLIYHAGAYPVGGSVSWDFRSGSRVPLASSITPSSSKKGGHRRAKELEQNVRGHRRAADAPKENNIGRISFSYDTYHMTSASPNTNVPLLMLSLPHHAASISSASELLLRPDEFDLVYRSIKGRMIPVVGNSWSYEEELTFTGFGDESLPAKTNIAQSSTSTTASGSSATSQRPIIHESTALSTLDQSIRDLLLQTVEADLKINLPVVSNGAYGFGKQIARVAQLAHIAEVVDAANVREVDASKDKTVGNSTKSDKASGAASSSSGSGTSRRAYALLEKYLTMWLVGDGNEKRLVYDAELGGILSQEGTEDIDADFGNARYNDHHFHYGYALYAAAILGRANPKFVAQYGPFVDALFYDVAHHSAAATPSGDESIFFPLARHKSWFDGHSFASGLFPFANGKSQESSSEAVNCYYGAYLWSRVRWGNIGDLKMVDFARLLLATEVTGAKTYWHMTPPQDSINSTTSVGVGGAGLVPLAYNPVFRGNYMVGNLGMTDVVSQLPLFFGTVPCAKPNDQTIPVPLDAENQTCTTWFGTENVYVHLINFMPVTAITAELFDKGYVKGERSVLSSDDSVESAWKGYSICNEAILDPNMAWLEAQELVSNQLDSGLSKSQALFWIVTREGFSPGTTVEVSFDGDMSDVEDDVSDGGIVPDEHQGPSHDKNASPAKPAKGNSNASLASCARHDKCVAANLQGSCCPTGEGVFLRCCS